MRVPFFQVDAFADAPFSGNPAAVMVLPEFLPDAQLIAIAAENNLSETAFLVPGKSDCAIRWFTPQVEVPLCGHATLASAFVLWERLGATAAELTFQSASGPLTVTREGDLVCLNFPARPIVQRVEHPPLLQALGVPADTPLFCAHSRYLVELDHETGVGALTPDMAGVAKAIPDGIAYVTARSDRYDFVCRVFAPGSGIDEDPVTGSAYTALAPYWARALNKTELVARQLSARGGEVQCALAGERILIKGRARLIITGEFEISP